jgi:hypothetical protein
MDLGSSWDDPYNKPLNELTGSLQGGNSNTSKMVASGTRPTISAIEHATGQTSMFKYLSMMVWTQGSPMSFTIPFVFQAFENTVTEVVDKIVALMMMVAPSEGDSGLLTAPGPTGLGLAGYEGSFGGEILTLKIGTFLTFKPVIVRSVSVEIDSQFDASGNPISAVVNTEIITAFTVTKRDIQRMFLTASNHIAGDQRGNTE